MCLVVKIVEDSRESLRMAVSGPLSLRVAVTGCLSWPAILKMRTETVFPAPKPMHSQLSVTHPCTPNFQSHAHARPTFSPTPMHSQLSQFSVKAGQCAWLTVRAEWNSFILATWVCQQCPCLWAGLITVFSVAVIVSEILVPIG